MKRVLLTAVAMVALCTTGVSAQSFLGNLKKAVSSGADTTQTASSSVGSLLGGVLGNVLSNSHITVADMAGEWTYSSPAVAFRSDNLLQKAGGAAAASTIEDKLKPYYQKAGITSMVLTVNEDSTFVMKMSRVSLQGSIQAAESGSDANFVFNFKAAGKINIGKVDAYVSKSGNTLSVTFDVSKLVTIVDKVSSISGIQAAKTLSTMLKSYDGVCAGFKFTKK